MVRHLADIGYLRAELESRQRSESTGSAYFPLRCLSCASSALSDRYTDHMAKRVTATDAKAKILRLLDDAEAGEEIEITRHGRPVARLIPASGARSLKGSFEGVAMTAVEEKDLFSTGEPWSAS